MRYVLLVLVALIACSGPSGTQIRTAREAEYKAPAVAIFRLAQNVAAENYQLSERDSTNHVFVTAPQFYNSSGMRQSPGAGNVVRSSPGSIQLRLKVQVNETSTGHVNVAIEPIVFQMVSGSPQPRPIAPNHPDMPPWVRGRVDALAVAIYDRAKQYVQP
jgi:hypothetical protein